MDEYDKKVLQQPSAFDADVSRFDTGGKYNVGLRVGSSVGQVDRKLGAGAGVPTMTTPAGPVTKDMIPVVGSSRGRGDASGLREQPKAPAYDANFAREAKRIITKRGLTRSQRAAQLGALETENTLQRAGISDDDPRARGLRDLTRQSTRRNLTASQRTQLQDVSGDILKDLTGDIAKEKSPEASFEDTLIKLIDDLGVNRNG
jgi:hypothetical protein